MSSGGETPHTVHDDPAPDAAPQMVVTPDQIDNGVDLIHRTALGVGKILMLDHTDIPRLLVSAGCRSLEQMIDFYEKRAEKMSVTERAALRLNVHTLASNLRDALAEALLMVDRVRESLDVKGEGE